MQMQMSAHTKEKLLLLMLAVFVKEILSLRQIFRTICKRNITPIVIFVGNNLKQAQIRKSIYKNILSTLVETGTKW
jgi:hypothetical protein